MRDLLETTVINTESVTARSVPGHGDQVELTIATKRGMWTIRLLARPDRIIRITDLRKRDKRKHAKTALVTTPNEL